MSLSALVLNSYSAGLVDILEFAESDYFLNVKLQPVQRLILKLLYKIPLSSDLGDDPIILKDDTNRVEFSRFYSEFDFMEYLYQQGRINSLDFENIFEVYLIVGRRGGKNFLSCIIAAYSLYTVLSLDDPHGYFRIDSTTELGLSLISNTQNNASRLFRELKARILGCSFFSSFLAAEPTGQSIYFRTRRALSSGKASAYGLIHVQVLAANAGVRGSSNFFFICDEFAHFTDASSQVKDKFLDDIIYEAMMPSLSTFMDDDGNPFGKAVFISSPNGKRGHMYGVYESSRDDSNTLVFNVPSWWSNPDRLVPQLLMSEKKKSELSFRQEYGAEFVEKETTFVPNVNVLHASFEDADYLQEHVDLRYRHYMALDLALTSDNATISICHYEEHRERRVEDELKALVKSNDVYVFDEIVCLRPVNGAISVNSVISKILVLCRKYNVVKVGFDQWSAEMFRQILVEKGIRLNLEQMNATSRTNDLWARTFKSFLLSGQLVFPDDGTGALFDEIIQLRERVTGHFIKVENTVGHDDMFNSMLKSLYLCSTDVLKGQFFRRYDSGRDVRRVRKANRSLVDLLNRKDGNNGVIVGGGFSR